MPGRLEDKVAIVTGAGRGIGRAAAALLAGEGADVACVARTGPELAEAAAGVRAAGRRAVQIQADIGDPDAAGLIAARVQAVLGDVDIVVNNAATVTPVGPTASIDPDQWARALAVNVAGPMRLTRALLDGMVKRGWGRIVNVSSGIAAAPGAMVGMNAYAASKAALEAHTLNLAAELAEPVSLSTSCGRAWSTPPCPPGSGPATRADRRGAARPVHGHARFRADGRSRPARRHDREPGRRRGHRPDRRRGRHG